MERRRSAAAAFSREQPHVERVTCFKVTPVLAEHAGELWARRWVDLHN